ncbi:MAG: porin, partial [Acidimicrobiia bacterium]
MRSVAFDSPTLGIKQWRANGPTFCSSTFRARARVLICLGAILCGIRSVDAQSITEASQEDARQKEHAGRVSFKADDHPSLRFGSVLRIDFRAKIQADYRDFSADPDATAGDFDIARRRVGIEGSFLKRFEYEVERELSDDPNPWRDVFVNFRGHRGLQVQAGRFK